MTVHLDFERPAAEINEKIEELKRVNTNKNVDFSDEISRLEKQSANLTQSIFSSLTPWQITQLARHPLRPHTMDYINRIFTHFQEIHGDRVFADDPAIIAGLARFNGHGVVVVGHQKGRDTNSKLARNFGMPKPEGYRKAQRICKLAERFSLPIFTFIDTPGAYPGIEAEERGQSEAIASTLFTLVEVRSPIIASIIGEGGSGGALAIGVADSIFMLQYSVYSVISPEGCASILWKDSSRAPDAANVMGLTADSLNEHGLVDAIIEEPLGGAHRDYDEIARRLKVHLEMAFDELSKHSTETLLEQRYQRLMSYGKFKPAS